MKYSIALLLAFFPSALIFGQSDFQNWLKKKEGFRIEPFMMLQLWSSYSVGQEVYNPEQNQYESVDDRLNVQLRRARLGFKAEPYEGLQFTIAGAYDLIGRDVLAGLVGGTNNGSIPNFGIWDAFFQWKIKKNSEAFNLVGGYFRPQLSRESITSGWSVNSMEKSMSQNYIRRHLVGAGPGRALGINLGGLLLEEGRSVGLNYNIGIFNPVTLANNGNSSGSAFAPLVVGRAVVYLGDPEMDKYKIGYDINYYGKRKGLSVGFGGSWQGKTDVFESSYAAEADVLFNWGPVNIDGDWNFMWREGSRLSPDDQVRSFTYASNTGHLRLGYNIIAGKKAFLEPSFMLMQFNGAKGLTGQADAKAVGAFSGSERTYDAGINWYLNKKHLKLMLHYTWREGDAGEAGPGFTGNQYFSQSEVGAIHRGNWLGLGLNAIF
ncbi:MAG: hypothetical protein H6560_20495 [Lewinellaceae bacterium]|nr:hypothetical protein [Lewinellaceae bacterium]